MGTTASTIRLEAAQFIVNCEARRDAQGKLRAYSLPAADGGGSFEVAGINDGYHPQMARRLRMLIAAGQQDEAEKLAVEYIADYTDVVTRWVDHPAFEAFLRDTSFNRGPKGALRVLQIAVGVADDGRFGPITQAAITERSQFPDRLLNGLRPAREQYERRIAPPVGARAQFWKGLVNRWDKTLAFSQRFLSQKTTT